MPIYHASPRRLHPLLLFICAASVVSLLALLTSQRAAAQASVEDFQPAPNDEVFSMAVQPDGKIVIGGRFDRVDGATRTFVARVDGAGVPDSFAPQLNGRVSTIAIQPDGRVIIGGEFTTADGSARGRLARFAADGTLDTAFAPNADGPVFSLLLQPDGSVVVGGAFTTMDGTARNHLARLNADGSVQAGFAPNVDDYVVALARQDDGKVLIGGAFTRVDGKRHTGIARLNSDGSVDNTFTPAPNDEVYAIAVQPDGKILVGGRFTRIGGVNTGSLVRLNADGSVDTAFAPAVSGGAVVSIALQADGKIVIGGEFSQVGGQARTRLARLNPDGAVDDTVNPGANGYVSALTIQPDGKILVGGAFTQIGGLPRAYAARLTGTGASTQTLTVSAAGDSVTWMRGGSAPELSAVTFEQSTGGGPFTALGQATRTPGGWTLTNVALPVNQLFILRARGLHNTNVYGAGSLAEATRVFEISAAALEVRTITQPPEPPSAWTITADGPSLLTTVLTGTATSGLRAALTGTYTITATPVDAVNQFTYTTTHACRINGEPGPAGDGAALTVTMDQDDEVRCTFSNVAPRVPVTFTKAIATGPAQPEEWTFTVNDESVAHGGALDLFPGVYTVTETGPAGYRVDGAGGACALVDETVQLTVAGADAAVGASCVITNTLRDTDAAINLLEEYGVTALTEGADAETEGSVACYRITANQAPDGPVTVQVIAADTVVAEPLTVALDAQNWENTDAADLSNRVCLRAVDDEIDARDAQVCKPRTTDPLGGAAGDEERCGDFVAQVAHRVVASADADFFDGMPFAGNTLVDVDDDPRTVDVLMSENDTAAVIVTPPASARISEGTSTTYTLRLATEPRATVQVTPTIGAALDVMPTVAQFDAASWRDPFTVTVTARQDFIDTLNDLSQHVIAHTVRSDDGNYAAATPDSVTLEVVDRDRAAVLFSRASLTVPSGATVRYGIVLAAKPTQAVTVVVAPSTGINVDVGCAVDGIRHCVVMTAENWDQLQVIGVTAANGTPGRIDHQLRSDDPLYNDIGASIPVNQDGTYAAFMPLIRQD